MSDIVRIIVILSILASAIYVDVKYSKWFYNQDLHQKLHEQSLINKDLNQKLNDVLEIVEYVEFSLDLNNKLIEEVLSEQIKNKGD